MIKRNTFKTWPACASITVTCASLSRSVRVLSTSSCSRRLRCWDSRLLASVSARHTLLVNASFTWAGQKQRYTQCDVVIEVQTFTCNIMRHKMRNVYNLVCNLTASKTCHVEHSIDSWHNRDTAYTLNKCPFYVMKQRNMNFCNGCDTLSHWLHYIMIHCHIDYTTQWVVAAVNFSLVKYYTMSCDYCWFLFGEVLHHELWLLLISLWWSTAPWVVAIADFSLVKYYTMSCDYC